MHSDIYGIIRPNVAILMVWSFSIKQACGPKQAAGLIRGGKRKEESKRQVQPVEGIEKRASWKA